jgi:di/tricarboxylate transporter
VSPLLILCLIIAAALALFVGGWIAVDVTALLVLSSLTLTGLVSPNDALAGFSSSAVITIMGMFIISAGLTHTGVSYQFGKPLQFFAKKSEVALMVALMVATSLLSALINTTTVAAIMLPATMELARRSGRNPSRLLMPMALGCILGGPFTGISTPPNMLVIEAMAKAGLKPFALFDFTPITGALVIAGILFMVLLGRFILPGGKGKSSRHNALEASYHIAEHIFVTRIRPGSKLAGLKLAGSRLGSALSLTVVGLQREDELILAPKPQDILRENDLLIVHGHEDHFRYFRGDHHLLAEKNDEAIKLIGQNLETAGAAVPATSSLIGRGLAASGLRHRYRVHLPAWKNASGQSIHDARRHIFAAGDYLVVQGKKEDLQRLVADGLIGPLCVENCEITGAIVLPMRVPEGSALIGKNLIESRLGNALGLTVIAIVRDQALAKENGSLLMPSPEEIIRQDDLLVLQGGREAIEALQALQELVMERPPASLIAELESQQVGITEVLLSPRTTLAGQTLADLLFREHYGLNVLAILRRGQPQWGHIKEMALQFGDALLVYGRRQSLEAVAHDPDFLVLDHEAAQAPLVKKGPVAAIITVAMLVAAILNWTPISIATLTGAALMVVTGCLSMERAYRAVEWRVIFLIAGMLPLGVAVQNTGAAQLAADLIISSAGHLGPRWVVAALFTVTVLATQIIPSSALVVLMAPIALGAARSLHISPDLLMMTIAMAASSNYASPFSHPAHMLVMGPGGYRFMDYIKIGVPLTIVITAVSVWLLPIFWPPY